MRERIRRQRRYNGMAPGRADRRYETMLPMIDQHARWGGGAASDCGDGLSLPVLSVGKTTIRPSRMSRRRAISLILVHVVMIGHGVQWLVTGKTLSPVEPSEAMYTFNEGHLNAGFIFFAVAILATLLFGRYFCGWGCHLVAYQDLCTWLLKKIRIQPKPFRSRLLVFAPLALALYMFVWPTAYRLYAGTPVPATTNHLLTTEFWKTFPGFWIALLTVAVCGFAAVYFLGAKGFCTYACPYGGFFGLADQVSAGRIRVNENCEQCGHCTAVCSSNVRVHEEVAAYGMVVDPGCMKCMDCVSVCPKDALSFGFGPPAVGATAAKKRRPRKYDFTLAEEVAMLVVGVGAVLAYRGLYNRIPLLLAMGMAGVTAFLLVKAARLVFAANVRFQNFQLKRGKRLTRAGVLYAAGSLALLAFLVHSGTIQYGVHRAHAALQAIKLPDSIWSPGDDWWAGAPAQAQRRVAETIRVLETVNRIGIVPSPDALEDLVWLYLARGDLDRAETTVRQLIAIGPQEPDFHRGLAGVLRKQKRFDDAEAAYEKTLEVDPSFDRARLELAQLLHARNRGDDAIEVLRAGSGATDDPVKWPLHISELLTSLARFDEARAELAPLLEARPDDPDLLAAMGFIESRAGNSDAGIHYWLRVIEHDPQRTNVRYNLAMALLGTNRIDEGVNHLEDLVDARPDFVQARYHLAVALSMSGRRAEALLHAERALELAPEDSTLQSLTTLLRKQSTASGAPHGGN